MTAVMDLPTVARASQPAAAPLELTTGRDARATVGYATMSDDDFFELVPLDEDWSKYEQKTNAVHTAQRLKKHDPQKYELLKRALEAGDRKTTLSKTHRVGTGTLYAIIEADLGGLEKHNACLSQKARRIANLAFDRVEELIPDSKSLMECSMVGGIMVDKYLALSGQPGLVVEVKHTIDNRVMDDFNAKILAAREELRTMREGTENAEKLKTEKLKEGVVIEAEPADFSVSAFQPFSVLPTKEASP